MNKVSVECLRGWCAWWGTGLVMVIVSRGLWARGISGGDQAVVGRREGSGACGIGGGCRVGGGEAVMGPGGWWSFVL